VSSFAAYTLESFRVAARVSADLRSFLELAYVMALAYVDRRKTRIRRWLLVSLPGLFLRAARGLPLSVRLRINGKVLRVVFARQSATEFWSTRSVITEVLVREVYRPGAGALRTVVDAGSNIGLATLYLYTLFPGAEFYCYEPSSETYGVLVQNLTANGVRFQAFQKALADTEGWVSFDTGRSSMERRVATSGDASGAERVPCATLGKEMDRLRLAGIDLLKVDVEGAEVLLLEGLGNRLQSVMEIVGEVHSPALEAGVRQRLESAGFATEVKDGHVRGTR
jgi:FkbM family methyltransferase